MHFLQLRDAGAWFLRERLRGDEQGRKDERWDLHDVSFVLVVSAEASDCTSLTTRRYSK